MIDYTFNMQKARKLANDSKCEEGGVGAIITHEVSGTWEAWAKNTGTDTVPCLCNLGDKYTCIHAEVSAIHDVELQLSDIDLSLARKKPCYIMFITKAPCVTCAATIINAKFIKEVVYSGTYSSEAGIKLLKEAGIKVTRMEEENVSRN